MSNIVLNMTQKLGKLFGMESDAQELANVLKNTVFRTKAGDPPITDEQMAALLIVSNQYGLNPFTREIFAFPDKNNGIVPVVSVDGWARIINDHPQFDGVEFVYGPLKGDGPRHEWIECVIYRKDRSKPIRVREFWSEVNRDTPTWKSHPNRMHRHKALIQCGRIAFGFGGIFDQDEAESIVAAHAEPAATGGADFIPKATPAAIVHQKAEVAEFTLTPRETAPATQQQGAAASAPAPAAATQTPAAPPPPPPPPKAATGSNDTIATAGWHNRLRAIAKVKNIPEADVLKHFELQMYDGISQGTAKNIADWLNAQPSRPAPGEQQKAA
jgi:phage recombination protein Bet